MYNFANVFWYSFLKFHSFNNLRKAIMLIELKLMFVNIAFLQDISIEYISPRPLKFVFFFVYTSLMMGHRSDVYSDLLWL